MLKWIVKNRTVWSFNCVYLENVFTNDIFDFNEKTRFGINYPTMVDVPENQSRPNQHIKLEKKIKAWNYL